MSWKLDNIDFESFGVYVSKSSGVFDMPRMIDKSINWLDENGKDIWQTVEDVKYEDREIVLSCWLKAIGYEQFKTKVAAFFTALTSAGVKSLDTPYGLSLDVSLQDAIQVTRKGSYVNSLQIGMFTLKLSVAGDDRRKFMSIYNAGALVAVAPYSDGSLKKSLGGIPEITFTTESNSSKNFGPGDYLIFGGEKYVSFDTPPEDQLSSNKYRYKLSFKHQINYLDDVQFRVLGLSLTSWQSTVDEVISMLITNSERRHPGLFVKGTVAATQGRLNVFSGESCLSVLTRIVKDFELEWEFKTLENGSIQINVKQSINTATGLTFEYGKDKELYRVSRPVFSRENICTHLYAYGSDKNLPMSYGHPQLKLEVEPIVFPYDGDPVERTKTFDIQPERTGEVTTYAPGTPFEIVDSSMDFDLKEVDGSGNTKWLINGQSAKIVFISGDMAGFEFEVQDYIHATKTFKLLPYTDETGTVYPTEDLFPRAGDECKILNINVPDWYVTDAGNRLSLVANAWLNELMTRDIPNELETKPRSAYQALYPGNLITLKHTGSGIEKTSRISEISTNLMTFVSVITLSNTVKTPLLYQISNSISKVESSVESVRVENAGSRLTGGVVSKTIPKLTKSVGLIDTDKMEAHAVGKTESEHIELSQLAAYIQSTFGVTVEATKTTWDRDLHVEGNITASEDIIAYVAGAVTSDVLSSLSASAPLRKSSDSNMVIDLTASQFEVVSGALKIKDSVLVPALHYQNIDTINGLTTALNNKLETSLKGSANGLAELDSNGFVKNAQLPSYVDDVLEYGSFAALPTTGESGKIYITTDTNKTYRWSGSVYAVISDTLALGTTSATAYRGDYGNTAYLHSQSEHQAILDGIGLVRMNGKSISYDNNSYALQSSISNINNTSDANKPVSTAQQTALDLKVDKVTGKSLVFDTDIAKLAAFSITADKLTIDRDTHITGNLTASGDVIAYVAGAVTSDVLSSLSGVAPIYKPTTSSVGIRIDSTQFQLNASNELQIKSGVVQPAGSYEAPLTFSTGLSRSGNTITNTITQYTHPATHAPSVIAQDASNRFVTDKEKGTWNGKLDYRTFGTAANNNTGDFIQNQFSTFQVANQWISGVIKTNKFFELSGGDGIDVLPIGNGLIIDGYAGEFRFYNSGGKVLGISSSGAATFASSINAPTYLRSGNDLFGSLSANYLPVWDGSKLVNSLVSSDGNIVGIMGVGKKIGFETLGAGITTLLSTVENYDFSIKNNRGSTSEFIVGNGYIYAMTSGVERFRISDTGIVSIPSTTPSTSPSTGALTVAGGLGVGGSGYFNGGVTISNIGIVLNETQTVSLDTRKWWVTNDVLEYGDLAIRTASTKGATTHDLNRLYFNAVGNASFTGTITTPSIIAGFHRWDSEVVFANIADTDYQNIKAGSANLTGLQVNGNATATGTVTASNIILTEADPFTTGAGWFQSGGYVQLKGSVNGFAINNAANTVSNLFIKENGEATFSGAILAGGNITSPSATFTTGAGAGKVLTSDGAGNASWASAINITGSIVAGGEITAFSDKRLKSNIQPLKVRGDLQPVTYIKDNKQSIGFIAQDVRTLYPELVVGDESKEMLSLNYQQLTAVLYAEIIELKREIRELKPN